MTTRAQSKAKQETTAQAAADQAVAEGHAPGEVPEATVAEGQVPGERQITAPGDGPADTTDPTERVSTVVVDGKTLAEAAQAGVGAVVGYVKTGEATPPGANPNRDTDKDRHEEYEVGGVRLRHNLETGKSERI
ncbi:hypothetical protein AMIS_2490 [Actinoplanes missouriensis 431]|uniref:Uncharacterized protein n=1 Tax=Actinoplanes missouriensis (strain ATCC 14538 / DSM 43046 / CBS 188.64 / JCM 3121 / NBRC 102363 / NCIMB 12654 / NRRL B-3342 / UNCC 431) TaxID=512565 RepID=I0GXI2_ACTM4|nr:hypothetical protein [Actinoplanes missouriensis]KOX45266.1 hypothetical protein ADL19_23380 [Streptomyces purpurogeneiscleroticus]BAL85469.1 hypothetical protein AMIS_2490 [Actinoplanes missouriensis 431]